MTKEETYGSSTIEELMKSACARGLLDDWYLVGDEVGLSVGTYEIELDVQAADRFVRSLLRNYENAIEQGGT